MKAYETMAIRAENYASQTREPEKKLAVNQTLHFSLKDGTLSRILDALDWLKRMPGRDEDKKPYVERIERAYGRVLASSMDDNIVIPQKFGGKRVKPLKDNHNHGKMKAGGVGYARTNLDGVGTDTKESSRYDHYFRKYPVRPCKTLEGTERDIALAEYLSRSKLNTGDYRDLLRQVGDSSEGRKSRILTRYRDDV